MSLFVAIPLVLIFSSVTLAMPAILAASAPINRAASRRPSSKDQLGVCSEAGNTVLSPAEERQSDDV